MDTPWTRRVIEVHKDSGYVILDCGHTKMYDPEEYTLNVGDPVECKDCFTERENSDY